MVVRIMWLGAATIFGGVALAGSVTKLDANDGTLFPSKHAFELLGQCNRVTPQSVRGSWDPSDAQIRELEGRLPRALADLVSTHHKTRQAVANNIDAYVNKNFTGYDRQYGGLLIAGRRLIYVNAFPHEIIDFDGSNLTQMWKRDKDWRNRAVTLCDGGQEFFGVLYDPVTGRFENFEFTGHL